ncbi:MAG TPA: Holliday junction branch migration protein RuvA [Acidimicrobiales bacterium]|nr:Holliday junction branch migration protein RuvA [Acidimicrobiales bacterium]
MIGSLRGVVLDRSARRDGAGQVLVEVGGVGYRVVVPAGALAIFGELGAPAFVHVHTHVREDAIILYGFPTRDERACFEALIGAHGVGPAVALALLSVHSPSALRRAVANADADALTLVPGVGKKTATRLLVELASRLDVDDAERDLRLVGTGAEGDDGQATARREVRTALASLGYGADEVRTAMSGLPAEGTVEDLLRVALRELAASR